MEHYEVETIRMIRALGSRLNSKRDESIADMYKYWSQTSASAGPMSGRRVGGRRG